MLASQNFFERNEEVASEALNPTALNRAEPMCIRSIRFKIAQQGCVNPSRFRFHRPRSSLTAYLRIGGAQRIGCRGGRARYTPASQSVACTTRLLTYGTSYG